MPDSSREARPRILVVEDDDDLRLMVQAALVDSYWLLAAPSLGEGLRRARIEHADLVVVDRDVVDFDARVVATFREEVGTPILLLADEGEGAEGAEVAEASLRKPLEPVELEARVALLLGRVPRSSGVHRLPPEVLSRIETSERWVEVPSDSDASTQHESESSDATVDANTPARSKGETLGPGCVVGARYEVKELLGRGGMGEVYRVFDRETSRELALKLIRADRGRKKESRRRFVEEAHVAAALENEHVVSIHGFGVADDGRPYFVMDFCSGGSLAALVQREGALPAPRAIAIVLQLLDALAAAHHQGILHRDIKPGNVVIEPGDRVRILDFGLARDLFHTEVAESVEGRPAVGTPLYMSPEQVRGDPSDQRTDLYAVGVVLYELLCGRPPFRAATAKKVMQAHQGSAPRPLSELADVSPALEAVVLKALAKDRRQRWQTAAEFAAALTGCA